MKKKRKSEGNMKKNKENEKVINVNLYYENNEMTT